MKRRVLKVFLTDEMYYYLKQKEGIFGSVQDYIRTLIYNDMNKCHGRVEMQEAIYEKLERIPTPIIGKSNSEENIHSELISELKTVFKKKKIGI